MNILEINVLVLAYLGDTIYEDYIRKHLINLGIAKVNDLQQAAKHYVSAKSQAHYLQVLMDRDQLSEEELAIVKRARNGKSKSHPKNCDIVTYKCATGLEALIGFLELSGKKERMDEIMKFILEVES